MMVTACSSEEEFQTLAMRVVARELLPRTGWIAFKQLMELVALMRVLWGRDFCQEDPWLCRTFIPLGQFEKELSHFSNFRTIVALITILSFNGENRQRTSNTWRPEQWWLSRKGSFSFQDLLTDLFQQKLYYLITGQRSVSSKRTLCGNTYCRHNLRMHHRR